MASAFERLLLPAECLLCRGLLPFARGDDLICSVCRYRWRPVAPPWCARCGQPEPGFGPCRLCAGWPDPLVRVRSAVWLDGAARDAVHALKYGGLWRVARDLADAMARLLPPPDRDSLLVPVPLGPRRWRERGYNQSGALAQALGRCWEVPVAHGLRRVRETASQTALTPTARLANVAGAFALAPDGLTPGRSPGVSPSSSLLILVDDVFTTGATLAECARALGRAGATRIAAVTFGRAAIPDFS